MCVGLLLAVREGVTHPGALFLDILSLLSIKINPHKLSPCRIHAVAPSCLMVWCRPQPPHMQQASRQNYFAGQLLEQVIFTRHSFLLHVCESRSQNLPHCFAIVHPSPSPVRSHVWCVCTQGQCALCRTGGACGVPPTLFHASS